MNRAATVVMVAVLFVGTVGALPGVMAQTQAEDTTAPSPAQLSPDGASGNASIAPGERLAGVVGVGEAEVAGEVSARAFGVAVSTASTNRSRAAIIGRQVGALDRDLSTLRDRQQELRRAHENGSISDGRYRAEMAGLVAQARTVNRLTNGTQIASRGVPDALLQQHGVNSVAFHRLRMNASEMTGPEASAIARSIAGPRAGGAMGRGPPDAVFGPPDAPLPGTAGNMSRPGPGMHRENGPNGGQDARSERENGTPDRPHLTDNRSDGPDRGGSQSGR